MIDPLTEVVTLLHPTAPSSKLVSGAGEWKVRRSESGRPFYCAVLEGATQLAVDGQQAIILEAGDFVLIPSAFDFTVSSVKLRDRGSRRKPDTAHSAPRDGEIRHGDPGGPPDVRMLIGYCAFSSPDARLLVSLLPRLVCVRGDQRLTALVELVREEFRERRPAREVVLARLLEVLLIEALRSTESTVASAGLLRGLADERLAIAIRRMHEHPIKAWPIAKLAREAGLSRSAFFERFSRAVGVAPMEYLLGWRMAQAKDLLRGKGITVAEVAERVGYGSASTFSVAFSRYVGIPPARYRRTQSPIP